MDMDQWLEIRRRVLWEGVSIRQILRETGMHYLLTLLGFRANHDTKSP